MKLSIITINRNNAAGLRKTIENVMEQTFTDIEYICTIQRFNASTIQQFNNSTIFRLKKHIQSPPIFDKIDLYLSPIFDRISHSPSFIPPSRLLSGYYRDTIGSFREGVSGSAFLTRYKLFFICRI